MDSNTALGTGTLTISGTGTTIGTQVEGQAITTIANRVSVTTASFSITNQRTPGVNPLAVLVGNASATVVDFTLNGVVDLNGATRTIIGGAQAEQIHFGTGGIGVSGETGVNFNTTFTANGGYVAFLLDPGNVNHYTG
ncbi:MAG: hypothetical protein WDN28_00910 [Chthoniobacter sp.]